MIFKRTAKLLSIVLFGTYLASCSSISKRTEYADAIAQQSGMKKQEVYTNSFILTTYYKITNKKAPINIYIEGDGFAVAQQGMVSSNPTPKDAFTLQLAAADPAANVVYIARPCQYTLFSIDKLCEKKYWAGSRFSEKVINSVNSAISHYTNKLTNPKINLIGYSGGAGVAVLIAAQRDDIITLRTVAGNLNHITINDFHHVDQLNDSLNPIDVSEKLASLPQYHFIGTLDKIIPSSVAVDFAKRTEKGNGCVKVSSVNGATHHSGWKENWQKLLLEPVACKTKKK